MSESAKVLKILLVEDDSENLKLLMDSLPSHLAGHDLHWEPCDDFEEAARRASQHHYDVVVTDIYRDRRDRRKGVEPEDELARDVIVRIRRSRFCPIVAFTDGSAPTTFQAGPFVKLADKTRGNDDILAKLGELIATGIPTLSHVLHDELDGVTSDYMWKFLEATWSRLSAEGLTDPVVLDRMVRRRLAFQIGRLRRSAAGDEEVPTVEGMEFYIYPALGDAVRLGEIRRSRTDGSFRIVLNPRCHLAVQPGDAKPRAEFVVTARAFPATDVIERAHTGGAGNPGNPWKGNGAQQMDTLRRRIQCPCERMGRPDGRYWFLPGFLDIPDMYCDFMQLESIPFDAFKSDHESVAQLDAPFAEALQACFTWFYSGVGLPELHPEKFTRLIREQEGE